MSAEPDFDRIAGPYRWLEYLTLGTALQNARTHFLPRLFDRRHALVLGDGDGRFLATLFRRNFHIRADAVDTSATMLRLLHQRCEAAVQDTGMRLRTHRHNALEHAPAADTDLIVAHFFFDCLRQPELDILIHRLAKDIQPEALWLVSDFRIPTGLMRLPAALMIRSLYLAFRLLTGLRTTRLPNYETPLQRAGLRRTHQHYNLFGLLTTELWTRPTRAKRLAPITANDIDQDPDGTVSKSVSSILISVKPLPSASSTSET